ncbi:MAG TPA: DJ-1/PfpI family protein [Solirubrobacteraceae bacterium]|nr:DJ-1/PfpI family protein [Solirubrobacteraceae bacterium]
MRTEILLFDGFDELDVFGPFEVLADNFDTALVTLEGGRDVTSGRGVAVRATRALSEPELLVVPGGGWLDGASEGVRAQIERGELPAAIAARHAAGATVASVCTGALLLAHAGVLDGRRATTNPLALDDLRAFPVEVVAARYVDDGDVLTAGAPACGIDLALRLVERARGADTAAAGARAIGHVIAAAAPAGP